MSLTWIDRMAIEAASQSWRSDAELVRGVARDLRGQSVSSMPPRVSGAATAFLVAWAGHADESEQIVSAISATLTSISTDYSVTDADISSSMTLLDGSLGSAR